MNHDITTHNTTTHHRSRRRMNAVAICIYCGNDMYLGTSCSEDPIRIRGVDYPPIRWGDEDGYPFNEVTERCGDCGVPTGAVHHHGCDIEECPSCHGRMLACGCTDEAEKPDRMRADRDEAEAEGDEGEADQADTMG